MNKKIRLSDGMLQYQSPCVGFLNDCIDEGKSMKTQNIGKILILGATGMFGHKLMQVLSKQFPVTGTVRGNPSAYVDHPFFKGLEIIGHVRADDIRSVETAIEHSEAHVVINCIGIVKQLPTAQDPLPSIAINALFPHQLASICRKNKIRLIHLSTDCVFSGRKGNYAVNEPSDAEDLYGKTKSLGEVNYPGCLTIRTSIIGHELDTQHGLIEWFLSQQGKKVKGYKKSVFSGLTTLALSEIIAQIVSDYPHIYGILQIASTPISKFDLLNLVKEIYSMDIVIEPDVSVINDRSLSPEKFKIETEIQIPSWEYMITQMYQDYTAYSSFRVKYVQ